MKNKVLGNSGLIVSELCLGTMTFGNSVDESGAQKIMERFFTNGGNFFDTANVYNNGKSEEILGKWAKGHDREEIVIATKVRFHTGNHPNSGGLTRKHIISSVKKSLQRLDTDYIDLLQVHAWDPLTPISETLSTLDSLVCDGLVRYIGASNFRAWQLSMAIDYSENHDLVPFISLQPQYNLLTRATEFELLPYCKYKRIGVLPWSPLKGGLLSGKYTKNMEEIPEGTRYHRRKGQGNIWPWNRDGRYVWPLLSKLKSIGNKYGKTQAQVSLRWLLQNPVVTSPILGVTSMEQLEEDLGATDFTLSEKDLEKIDKASRTYVSYPYDVWAERQQQDGRTLH